MASKDISILKIDKKEITNPDGSKTEIDVRTSTVHNKIQIVNGAGEIVLDETGRPVTFSQTFSMTNDHNAPLMTFTLDDGSQIGSIMAQDGNYFLKVTTKVIESLPEELKSGISTYGDSAMLNIRPIEIDGVKVPPIQINAETGELKVQIQAKDGSAPYTCNFSATGVRMEYNGTGTTFTPKNSEGQKQIINVQMSTSAFEDMVKPHQGMFRLNQSDVDSSAEILNPKEIPPFMIGTYIEAMKDDAVLNSEGVHEIIINPSDDEGDSQKLKILVARLPDPERSGEMTDYYFVKGHAKNAEKLYVLHNGKLQENTNAREHYYRCYTDDSGSPTEASLVMKLHGGHYFGIGLELNESSLSKNALTVQNAIERFISSNGDMPAMTRQASSKHETINGIMFDAADSTIIKPVTPVVRGRQISEEELEDEKIDDVIEEEPDEVAPEEEPEIVEEPEEQPQPKEKKAGPEKMEVKMKEFPQFPGEALMLLGIFLLLGAMVLGPFIGGIVAGLGGAVFVAGGVYCTATYKLNNPYTQVKREIIKPKLQQQQEEEDTLENVYEQDSSHAKAETQYSSELEDFSSNPFLEAFEIFGENAEAFVALFLSEDNIDKREDLVKALNEYRNAKFLDTPEDRARLEQMQNGIIQTFFRDPNSHIIEGEALEQIKAKVFNGNLDSSITAITKYNTAQRSLIEEREKMAQTISNLSDKEFDKLLHSKSPEYTSNFIARNSDAIAKRILQKNLSKEEIAAFSASLPDEKARQSIENSITTFATASQAVKTFVEQNISNSNVADNYQAYSEAIDKATEYAKAETPTPSTTVPEGYTHFVTEDVATSAMETVLLFEEAQSARETAEAELENMGLSETTANTLVQVLRDNVSSYSTTIQTATKERNEMLHKANFFAQTTTGKTITEQIEEAVRREAIAEIKRTKPKEAKNLEEKKTDELITLASPKPDSKLETLQEARKKQNEINENIKKASEKAITSATTALKDKITVAPDYWEALVNSCENTLSTIDRAKIITLSPEQRHSLFEFIVANKENGTTISTSKLISMTTKGKISELAQKLASAVTSEEVINAKKEEEANEALKVLDSRKKQFSMLDGLTPQQRKAILARKPESYAQLAEVIKEIVGKEKLLDGREFADLVERKVEPRKVKKNFETAQEYKRRALKRRLGDKQMETLEQEHREVYELDLAAKYVKESQAYEKTAKAYETYCESLDKIAEMQDKAKTEGKGSKLITQADILEDSTAYIHEVSSVESQEMLNLLKSTYFVEDGTTLTDDPVLKAVQQVATDKQEELQAKLDERDKVLTEIGLFNEINEEIVARHGTGRPLPYASIEQLLESQLDKELRSYLQGKSKLDLTKATTAEMLGECSRTEIGAPKEDSRLAGLIKANKLQKEIETVGSGYVYLSALIGAMERESSGEITDATKAKVKELIDKDPNLLEKLKTATKSEAREGLILDFVYRYVQNGGKIPADEMLELVLDETIGTLATVSQRAVANGEAERDAENNLTASKNLKAKLDAYEAQYEGIKELTPEQRKAIREEQPKNWEELKKAVRKIAGKEILYDGKTFKEAKSSSRIPPVTLRETIEERNGKSRVKLEETLGKAKAAELIARLERKTLTERQANEERERQDRALAEELEELKKRIEAVEKITDKAKQTEEITAIKEKCKEEKFKGIFNKRQSKLDTIREAIEKRLAERKARLEALKQEQKEKGLSASQIKKRCGAYAETSEELRAQAKAAEAEASSSDERVAGTETTAGAEIGEEAGAE